MLHRKQLVLFAVVGVTMLTAYSFAKGPFGLPSPREEAAPPVDPPEPAVDAVAPVTPPVFVSEPQCDSESCRAAQRSSRPSLTQLLTTPPPSQFPSQSPSYYPATTTQRAPYPPPISTVDSPPGQGSPPAPLVVQQTGFVTTTSAVPPTAAVAPVTATPIGHWTRNIGPLAIELEGTAHQLEGTFAINLNEDVPMHIGFTVEYSVTADGLLYGVIQSADLELPKLPADTDLDEILGLKTIVTKLIDQPVSMRCRNDGGTLTIKSFALGIPMDPQFIENVDAESLQHIQSMFIGRYKPAGR